MATDTSATMREHTPHATQTTRTATIVNALTRRAHAVLNDTSLDGQTRAIIRYGLETNDPWLAQLVKRVETGESIVDTFEFSQPPKTNNFAPETNEIDSPKSYDSTQRKIDSTRQTACNSTQKLETLAEIICRSGDESAAALFVLMGILQDSAEPKALANTVKHSAFTRCGELNLYGMVDAQIAFFERALVSN